MTIFDEWEGRDPLDFENRPKSSKKKQNTPPKSKKPFHKTPAGIAFGCFVWIGIIALVWSSCAKFNSNYESSKARNETNFRPITPEEQKFIGQHARNVMAMLTEFETVKNSPEVQKERVYSKKFHIWQDKVKADAALVDHYLIGSHLKEYDDIREAYSDLIFVSGAFVLPRGDYSAEEKKYFPIIKRNCAPYLEWQGTPDTSKILKSATLDWSQCPESDKIQIGAFARYLNGEKQKFLEAVNDPDFVKHGYKVSYKAWNDELTENLHKLIKNVPYEKNDFYMDVENATFDLVNSISYAKSWCKSPNFKEKVDEFVQLFDEQLTPYLDW